MNCQEFDQVVADLVTDQLASARTRIAALTHAASCERCDARLLAERTLNHGLFALAEHTSGEQAPLRLRQSLRAAFEAEAAKEVVGISTPKVIRLTEFKPKPMVRRQWVWGLAAAAMILCVVAVSVWRSQSLPKNSTFIAAASPTPAIAPVVSPEAPKVLEMNTGQVAAANPVTEKEPVKQKRQPQLHRQQLVQSSDTELAANYIPLSYAAGSATPNESMVVRVDVSRTTLIAMGLPLNSEFGSTTVKADLKVGLDGVPLAIRLVR